MDEIDERFTDFVVSLIHNDKHEVIFRALKDIIRDDDSINENTIVGKMAWFECGNILNYDSFDESALLANVVTYAIIK